MKYYEINIELLKIFNEIEENEGEISEEIEAKLAQLEEQKEEKIQQFIWLFHQKKTELEGIKQRKSALDAMQKTKQKQIEFVERVLEQLTQNSNWTNGVEKISYRKSKSVVVDEDVLPIEYFVVKETKSPDKKLLKERIESGEVIEGAKIEEKLNIQVK